MNAKNYIDEMDLENNKVNDLNKQLNDEINMLKNDNTKLKKIKEEYKPLKNKYEEDVGKLNEQITILTNKCQNFNSFINSNISSLLLLLCIKIFDFPFSSFNFKNEELNLIKSKIGFDIKDNEEIMTIIFKSMDQKIHHAFICKDSDKL